MSRGEERVMDISGAGQESNRAERSNVSGGEAYNQQSSMMGVGGGSSSSLTFRSEASWPLRYQIHTAFDDGFPKLREKLVANQANELGNYIYHFGFCDFDSQDDADNASICLKDICNALAVAVQSEDEVAMKKKRNELEIHLCYWKKNPVVSQQQATNPPLLAESTMISNPGLPPATVWNILPESTSSNRTATLSAAAAAVAASSQKDTTTDAEEAAASCRQKKSKADADTRIGRWSEAEHKLFLDLMKEHGRSWTQIAAKIPTRSEPQVRSHAQKHFLKLNKDEKDTFDNRPAKRPKDDAASTLQSNLATVPPHQSYINNPAFIQNVRVYDQFGLNPGGVHLGNSAASYPLMTTAANTETLAAAASTLHAATALLNPIVQPPPPAPSFVDNTTAVNTHPPTEQIAKTSKN